jgi:hypothetical protein
MSPTLCWLRKTSPPAGVTAISILLLASQLIPKANYESAELQKANHFNVALKVDFESG